MPFFQEAKVINAKHGVFNDIGGDQINTRINGMPSPASGIAKAVKSTVDASVGDPKALSQSIRTSCAVKVAPVKIEGGTRVE
jgi:hypothetical protein